jgi:ParB family chromosome partitioning protein
VWAFNNGVAMQPTAQGKTMRKALGKGLEALFPEAATTPAPAERWIPTDQIHPNRSQPRQRIDEDALAELADSIRQHGIIQPLLVRRVDEGYELIAGERRWRAAQLAGLDRVAAVVREVTDSQSFELALIENIQRQDLSALEEAEAYRRMVEEFGLTQDEVAARVGKNRATVANMLRLLALPGEVKEQIAGGKLTMGHARALLAAPTAARQLALARDVITRGLSVRDTERLAAVPAYRGQQRKAGKDVHVRAIEEELCALLGTRVRLLPRGRGGAIEIHYHSGDALERLLNYLRGQDLRQSNIL